MAISSSECGFLHVILMDSDLMVPPAKINLGEQRSTLESVDEVINEGDGESVLLGDLVKCSIVNAHPEFPIFFLDEYDRGTIWRQARFDRASFQKSIKFCSHGIQFKG
jgi:hypothetical protein